MMIVPEIHGLRRMSPSEAAEFAGWEKNERPYPWSERQFLETSESLTRDIFVWEEQRVIYGFAALQMIEQESYLLNIMINPLHRRKGKGKQLMDMLLDWSRACGVTQFFLDVDPSNQAAFRLYRKEGFEIIGRRPNAYPQGEESFLLRKDL